MHLHCCSCRRRSVSVDEFSVLLFFAGRWHGCDFREINHVKTPDPSRHASLGCGPRSNAVERTIFFSLGFNYVHRSYTVIKNVYIYTHILPR